MTRLLATLALILAGALLLDRGLSAGLGRLLLASDDRFVAIYRAVPAAGLVVLGNSRADNHFPADRLAALTCGPAVNLGMGGAPMVVSEALWEDYLERHGPPRLLVIEPTSVMDDPAVLADAPLLAHFSERVGRLVRETDPTLWASGRVFHLLTLNSNQTIRILAGLLRGHAGDRTLTGHIDPARHERIAHAPTESWRADPRNLGALDRIVASARRHDVQVLVVLTPLYRPFTERLANYASYFAALTARLPPEVPVIDLRTAVEGDEHFVDPLHINREGVELMLARLEGPLARAAGCWDGQRFVGLPASSEAQAPQ